MAVGTGPGRAAGAAGGFGPDDEPKSGKLFTTPSGEEAGAAAGAGARLRRTAGAGDGTEGTEAGTTTAGAGVTAGAKAAACLAARERERRTADGDFLLGRTVAVGTAAVDGDGRGLAALRRDEGQAATRCS